MSLYDEFFDMILKADSHNQARIEISALENRLNKLGTQCGDCTFWMNNKRCPREVLQTNGYWKGPSCAGSPCSLYEESESTSSRKQSLRIEIQEKKENLQDSSKNLLTT